MKQLWKSFKKWYRLGFKWSMTKDCEDELLMQVYYIQAIIVQLVIFFNMKIANFNLYLIFVLAHLVGMYVLGFLRDQWGGDKKEEKYFYINEGVEITLILLSFFVVKSIYYVLTVAIATAVAMFITPIMLEYIIEFLDLILEKIFSKTTMKEKIEVDDISYIFINISCWIFAIIAIFATKFTIGMKILLSAIYILSIPIITIAADNGMNCSEIIACDIMFIENLQERLDDIYKNQEEKDNDK